MYFKDDDRINDLLSKPSVTESVFTSWMAANQMYHDAKKLTCGQFVSKFVTFTCNPCWPKIQRLLDPLHLKAYNRPDVFSRYSSK